MTTTLSADGFIEIPEVFRKADALAQGQTCEIERLGQGEYRVRVGRQPAPEGKESWVKWLLECPRAAALQW